MKNINDLKNNFTDYAKDIRINLENLFNEENSLLTKKQILATALACAYACKEKTLIKIMESELLNIVDSQELRGVKIAAIMMAMNNIYYRFLHLTGDKEFSQMPAGLRMRSIIDHGVSKDEFEIFSLAISVINGCSSCIDAHINQLINHQYSKLQIQAIVKIAATMSATAQMLQIESSFN